MGRVASPCPATRPWLVQQQHLQTGIVVPSLRRSLPPSLPSHWPTRTDELPTHPRHQPNERTNERAAAMNTTTAGPCAGRTACIPPSSSFTIRSSRRYRVLLTVALIVVAATTTTTTTIPVANAVPTDQLGESSGPCDVRNGDGTSSASCGPTDGYVGTL